MATIFGSQFTASAVGGATVNVVLSPDNIDGTNGQPLSSDTIAGDFNLEVYTGPVPGPTTLSPGYQGLAILGPGGATIELVAGSGYSITDAGDTLTTGAGATGDTIAGGNSFSNLILNGTGNTADGGIGGNYIEVDGPGNTVNTGLGPNAVNVFSDNDTINIGGGNSTVTILGNNAVVTGGGGSDTITAFGNDESITGPPNGTGPELINATGTGDTITAGSGNDTLNVFNNNDTVNAGSGADTIGLYGASGDVATGGTGPATIISTGTSDTVNAGTGNLFIQAYGGNFQFNGTTGMYNDTIVGFQPPMQGQDGPVGSGDHIHLTAGEQPPVATLQPNGQDTLLTLADGSTILLKGITSVNPNFFN